MVNTDRVNTDSQKLIFSLLEKILLVDEVFVFLSSSTRTIFPNKLKINYFLHTYLPTYVSARECRTTGGRRAAELLWLRAGEDYPETNRVVLLVHCSHLSKQTSPHPTKRINHSNYWHGNSELVLS